jgi:hypothetical protein
VIPDCDSVPFRLAIRQLEDGEGAATGSHAPGPNVRRDFEDISIFCEEHDVDRETHEKRVDRGRWLDQEALAGAKLAFPEKSLHAREHSICDGATLADDRAIAPRQGNDASSAAQTRRSGQLSRRA